MKKIALILALTPLLAFSQSSTTDTSDFKKVGSYIKQKYTRTYVDSAMLDSAKVANMLSVLEFEFNQQEAETNAAKDRKQAKRRAHNRLLTEAKKNWLFTKPNL